jgi:S-adenosylmethionine hydrolase
MSLITLLTDFGLKDGNVGVMKGVILGIAQDATIVDLSHQISPQNVHEAALILLRSAPYFPASTIHVVVVDPGVGTSRRPIAAQLGDQYFVGPDNGVITMLLDFTKKQGLTVKIFHLNQPQYWLAEVSNVFHGRDIFAPAAGHLVSGVSISSLGTSIDNPIQIQIPQPEKMAGSLRGEVIHIDHFGNISTNVKQEHLVSKEVKTLTLNQVSINGMIRTFGERPEGELVALFGSTGNLIISVVNGNAALRLKTKVGDKVEVFIQ